MGEGGGSEGGGIILGYSGSGFMSGGVGGGGESMLGRAGDGGWMVSIIEEGQVRLGGEGMIRKEL